MYNRDRKAAFLVCTSFAAVSWMAPGTMHTSREWPSSKVMQDARNRKASRFAILTVELLLSTSLCTSRLQPSTAPASMARLRAFTSSHRKQRAFRAYLGTKRDAADESPPKSFESCNASRMARTRFSTQPAFMSEGLVEAWSLAANSPTAAQASNGPKSPAPFEEDPLRRQASDGDGMSGATKTAKAGPNDRAPSP
jgi:hypothetical protein